MKALVAEDDGLTRRALAEILEAEGWTVRQAPEGATAVELFAEGGYQLVCLDVMMPKLSGYDVCRLIRQTDRAVPVLFISAKSEEIDKVVALELGADDFIVKPFGVREVLARIRAILRRSGWNPETTGPSTAASSTFDPLNFVIGPWRIDKAALRAFQADAWVELTPREWNLLALLAERPGRVVSRADFWHRCWDLDTLPQSRTIDQHIAQLRKKLEVEPAEPRLIKTVQGVGYRYEAVDPPA